MTGYANASASVPTASAAALHEASRDAAAKAAAPSLSVEIRSVNGRFLDIAMRLPDELRGLEPALRAMLTARFKRGKIELRLSGAGNVEGAVPEPTPEQLAHLARVDGAVRDHLPHARPLSVHEALQWCRGAPDAQPEHAVLAAAEVCVERLAEARAHDAQFREQRPDRSLLEVAAIEPYENAADLDHLLSGLRRAGVSS